MEPTESLEPSVDARFYLLDTDILAHYLRGDAIGAQIRRDYNRFSFGLNVGYSIISEAELRALAQKWQWSETQTQQILDGLRFLHRLTIDAPEIIRAYALIDAISRRMNFGLGENDLWIAATAVASGATLLTTDGRFNHLPDDLPTRERITLQNTNPAS